MSNPLPAAKSRGVQNELQFGCQKFLLHSSEVGAVSFIFQFGHLDTHVVLFKKSFFILNNKLRDVAEKNINKIFLSRQYHMTYLLYLLYFFNYT